MINIEKIEDNIGGTGHITNCYLVYNENNDAILIDAGYEYDKIIRKVKKLSLNLRYIVLTHAHADHIGALEKLQEVFKCEIIVHKNDYDMLVSKKENYAYKFGMSDLNKNLSNIKTIEDSDSLIIGNMNFEFIHTPGHTSGSICIYEKSSNVLFTGDTIFKDCYGRCDLYSGNIEDIVDSIKKIFSRFSDILIYPGHDEVTNIENAKKYIRMLLAFKGYKI